MSDNLRTHKQYRTWQNTNMTQEVLLSDIRKQLKELNTTVSTLQTSVDNIHSSVVLYDATWDFVGTMEALEDTPGSGNWYWGGYNSDADTDVLYDYGWTVSEYDSDVYTIIDAVDDQFDGVYYIGLPVYADNTGKTLGKTLIIELSCVGHYNIDHPDLYIRMVGYTDSSGTSHGSVPDPGLLDSEGDDTVTFSSNILVETYQNTAYEIATALDSNNNVFELSFNNGASGAGEGASFTVTSPIRVRILMQP